MPSRNALGNLKNRYRAVLKKCHLLNTFGSLAMASLLVMGSANVGMGTSLTIDDNLQNGAVPLDITGDGIATSPLTIEKNITLLKPEGITGAVSMGSVTLGHAESTEDLYVSIGADFELDVNEFNVNSGVIGYASENNADTSVILQDGAHIKANTVTLTGQTEYLGAFEEKDSAVFLDLRKGFLSANSIVVNNSSALLVNSNASKDLGNIELTQGGVIKIEGSINKDSPYEEGYGGLLMVDGELDFTTPDSLISRVRLSKNSELAVDGTATLFAEDLTVGPDNIFQDSTTSLSAQEFDITAPNGELFLGMELSVVNASNNLGLEASDVITLANGGTLDFGHGTPPEKEVIEILGYEYRPAFGNIESTINIMPDSWWVEVDSGDWKFNTVNIYGEPTQRGGLEIDENIARAEVETVNLHSGMLYITDDSDFSVSEETYAKVTNVNVGQEGGYISVLTEINDSPDGKKDGTNSLTIENLTVSDQLGVGENTNGLSVSIDDGSSYGVEYETEEYKHQFKEAHLAINDNFSNGVKGAYRIHEGALYLQGLTANDNQLWTYDSGQPSADYDNYISFNSTSSGQENLNSALFTDTLTLYSGEIGTQATLDIGEKAIIAATQATIKDATTASDANGANTALGNLNIVSGTLLMQGDYAHAHALANEQTPNAEKLTGLLTANTVNVSGGSLQLGVAEGITDNIGDVDADINVYSGTLNVDAGTWSMSDSKNVAVHTPNPADPSLTSQAIIQKGATFNVSNMDVQGGSATVYGTLDVGDEKNIGNLTSADANQVTVDGGTLRAFQNTLYTTLDNEPLVTTSTSLVSQEIEFKNFATLYIKDETEYEIQHLENMLSTLDTGEFNAGDAFVASKNVNIDSVLDSSGKYIEASKLGNTNLDFTQINEGNIATVFYDNTSGSTIPNPSFKASQMVVSEGQSLDLGKSHIVLVGKNAGEALAYSLDGNPQTPLNITTQGALTLAGGTGILGDVDASQGSFNVHKNDDGVGEYTLNSLTLQAKTDTTPVTEFTGKLTVNTTLEGGVIRSYDTLTAQNVSNSEITSHAEMNVKESLTGSTVTAHAPVNVTGAISGTTLTAHSDISAESITDGSVVESHNKMEVGSISGSTIDAYGSVEADTMEDSTFTAHGNFRAVGVEGSTVKIYDKASATSTSLRSIIEIGTTKNSTIEIGGYDSTGSVKIEGAENLSAFSDPSWESGLPAARAIFGEISGGTNLHVGRNSYMVVGKDADGAMASEEWLPNQMTEAGLSIAKGGVESAFGVYGRPLDLTASQSNSAILVNNNSSATTLGSGMFQLTDASFESASLLVVDARAGESSSALVANNITVEHGAKLLISDLDLANSSQTTVKIALTKANSSVIQGVDENGIATDINGNELDVTYWGFNESVAVASKVTAENIDTETLLFDSAFISAQEIEVSEINGFVVHVALKNPGQVFPNLDPALAKLVEVGIIENAQGVGMEFVKAASLETHGDVLIEGAAKLGVSGNSMQSLASISDASVGNIVNRTSFISVAESGSGAGSVLSDGTNLRVVDAAGSSHDNGFALWVQPLYQDISSDGFKSGNFKYGYDSDFFGASVGADYTFDKTFRVGAAFHIGTGESTSNGDFASTKNEFDYYGMSLYGAYWLGDLGLSADIGYTESGNEVRQKTSLGALSADFDASVFTVGTRAEYRIDMGDAQIVPHVGLRYNRHSVEDYNTKIAGETAFHTKTETADIFAIPVGVAIEGDFTTASGIKIKPKADIGVQFTMGDLDVAQKVNIANVSGIATLDNEIFDPVTFVGGVGLGIEKGNFSLNLGYKINASSNVVSHGVHGVLTFKF